MSIKKTLIASLIIAIIVFSIAIIHNFKQEEIRRAKSAIDIVKKTEVIINFKSESINTNISEAIDKYDLQKNIWNEEDETRLTQEKTTWTATSASDKNIYDVTAKNNIYNSTYTFNINVTSKEISPTNDLAKAIFNKNKKIDTKSRI